MSDPIPTRRLSLRSPTIADLPGYLAYRNAPGSNSSVSEEEGRRLLHEQMERQDNDPGWRMFCIEPLERTALLGEVGVFIAANNPKQGDIGWWLHPDHRGRGYAAEAAQGLVDWCFHALGLHRLTANCLSINEPSIAVMRRIGMRFEGQSIQSCLVNGVWKDESRYALLHSEWLAVPRGADPAEQG